MKYIATKNMLFNVSYNDLLDLGYVDGKVITTIDGSTFLCRVPTSKEMTHLIRHYANLDHDLNKLSWVECSYSNAKQAKTLGTRKDSFNQITVSAQINKSDTENSDIGFRPIIIPLDVNFVWKPSPRDYISISDSAHFNRTY